MDLRRQKFDLHTKLFHLLKEKAFKRELVTLASGRKSDFYFDMKPAMLDPKGATWMAELVMHELQGIKADCIGGLVMGAVPLVSPVAITSQKFVAPEGILHTPRAQRSRHQKAYRGRQHRRNGCRYSRRCHDLWRFGHGGSSGSAGSWR